MTEFIDIFLVNARCPSLYQRLKILQLSQSALGQIEIKHHWLLDDLPQAHTMQVCGLGNFSYRCISNTTCRIVDDSTQCLLVIRISYHTEIGNDILYFLALVETQPSIYSIRYTVLTHLFLKGTALCIRSVKNGKVRKLAIFLPADALNIVTYYHRFLLVTIGRFEHQALTFLISAEYIFVDLSFILPNQTIRSLYNKLSRAVVLFQFK